MGREEMSYTHGNCTFYRWHDHVEAAVRSTLQRLVMEPPRIDIENPHRQICDIDVSSDRAREGVDSITTADGSCLLCIVGAEGDDVMTLPESRKLFP